MQFVSHSHKMALISLGSYYLLLCIGNPDLFGNGLKREEEGERERVFLFTISSRRREKLIKGREFQEAASMDPILAKTEWANVFFRQAPQNQCAWRTRNREINHRALTEEKREEKQFTKPTHVAVYLF